MRSRLKYIVPCVIWVGVIFTFSSKYFSAKNTSTWLFQFIHEWFESFSRHDFWTIHGYIRKSAHVFAYSILSYLTSVALLKRFNVAQGEVYIRTISSVFLFCLSIAILDEYNQSHIQVRTGTYKDVLIDMLGVSLVQAYIFFTRYNQKKM